MVGAQQERRRIYICWFCDSHTRRLHGMGGMAETKGMTVCIRWFVLNRVGLQLRRVVVSAIGGRSPRE